MTRKFTEVLEEYLDYRDRLNGDYYDNRYIGERMEGRYHMQNLEKELNKMVHGVEE